MPHRDLLVCLRCHRDTDLVLDTVDAARTMLDPRTSLFVCAVDRDNQRLGQVLSGVLGQDHVYVSQRRWGWGAGLYGLFVESMIQFRQRFRFSHFMSIDYDTLFIKPGADHAFLNLIQNDQVGLAGHHVVSHRHWLSIFQRERDALSARLGGIPRTYVPGEGVQGGFFMLTEAALAAFDRRKFFLPPWNDPGRFTTIADDHLFPLLVRSAGLDIVPVSEDLFSIEWRLLTDPVRFDKMPILAFHPTKAGSKRTTRGTELLIRNHYRKRRGREPLN